MSTTAKVFKTNIHALPWTRVLEMKSQVVPKQMNPTQVFPTLPCTVHFKIVFFFFFFKNLAGEDGMIMGPSQTHQCPAEIEHCAHVLPQPESQKQEVFKYQVTDLLQAQGVCHVHVRRSVQLLVRHRKQRFVQSVIHVFCLYKVNKMIAPQY